MLQAGLPLIFKRIFDISAASVLVVAAAPVLAVAAVAIVATDGRPVFFVQKRPGRGGVPFDFYKLRTMRNAPEKEGDPRFDDDRMSPIGRMLRATSIDELPQLFNVLKGDMSLVGPRPLLVKYLPRYSPEQARRHDVLPGITGWAAVNGRNALSWDQKFALDVWYVDHWSPLLDLRILAKTVVKVLAREGVEHGGEAVTMPEFMGNDAHA